MMSKRVGLIGCGAWGRNIFRDLLLLECHVLVADTNSEARNWALQHGALGVFPDAIELPSCDGYIVAVPIPELAPVCKGLLIRQKPVFAEKTLCQSMKMAEELENIGGNEFIFAMHKWHYHPGVEALRIIASSGRIGKIKELFSIRHGWVDDFHGGDIFWTLSVHDLTIVKHILGYIPQEILMTNICKDRDGLAYSLTAVIGTSPAAYLCINGRHPEKMSSVSIYGDKGVAILHDATADHILVRDENGVAKVKIDTTFPLFLELKEFVDFLNGGERPRCTFQNAKEITQVILKLQAKASTL